MKIERKAIINGKERELVFTINEKVINETIKYNWNSLIFPENNVEIANIKCKELKATLVLDTDGDTCVIDHYDSKDESLFNIYKRSEIADNDELMEAIKTGDVYEKDRWNVDSNNWFEYCVYSYKNDKWVFEADDVFVDEPSNIDEFISLLEKYFIDMYENLELEEKIN